MIAGPIDPRAPSTPQPRDEGTKAAPSEPGAELLHIVALARKLIDVERRALAAAARSAAVSAVLLAAGALVGAVLLVGAAFTFLRGLTGAVAALTGASEWASQLVVGAALPLMALLAVRLVWARGDRRRAAQAAAGGEA